MTTLLALLPILLCRLVHAARNYAMLPGPAPVWESGWVSVPSAAVRADDVSSWPYFSPVGGFSQYSSLAALGVGIYLMSEQPAHDDHVDDTCSAQSDGTKGFLIQF